jgi:hypothetical protein
MENSEATRHSAAELIGEVNSAKLRFAVLIKQKKEDHQAAPLWFVCNCFAFPL